MPRKKGRLGDIGKVLLDLRPVDDLPDVLEVIRTTVLVVEVVCVFPDINLQVPTKEKANSEHRTQTGRRVS